ncbi:MAG: helix-turn-helix transcriptional regulator [Phycisphaerae bacterium]|nr:helix-turn-helix transcriptional regulator [Phycisphaerae bacterium]
MADTSAKRSASSLIRQKFYDGHPDRIARLEKARQSIALGDQIRRAREAAGMTQAELAEIINTKPSAISRLEDADYEGYSVKTLRKIAEAVHMWISIEFKPRRGERLKA